MMIFLKECYKCNAVQLCKFLEPVFILSEDRQNYDNIENKNKSEIINAVQSEIQKLKEMDVDLGMDLISILNQYQLYFKG